MKKIVLISMHEGAAQLYRENILSVFGEKLLDVQCVVLGKMPIPKEAELYLVPKSVIESECNADIEKVIDVPLGIPVIDLVVEFRKKDIEPLRNLPAGRKCLLVNVTKMLAMEVISELHNTMGIYHLELFPYGGDVKEYDVDIETAITVGEQDMVPLGIPQILDLGIRPVGPETIVEIALNLNYEFILEQPAFLEYSMAFANDSARIRRCIQQYHYYENSLDMMIELMEASIIGINEDGKIFCCNKKAAELLKSSKETVIGSDAEVCIPFVDFKTVKERKIKSVFLTKYGNTDINVAVNPIIMNDLFKGIMLVIEKFHEQENKQSKARLQLLRRGHHAKYTFDNIVGESKKLKDTCELAKKMAMTNSTVLIIGETGTGKELLASAIHNASTRKQAPYIAINCSAVPENLLESELFGYDEGAFTGAKKDGKLGLFEYAHQGTLFLDEIEDMSNALQIKLLRVLQEKEIMRIGGNQIIKVDVRIIAASNQDLYELVQKGKFRKDLYYRLNTLQLELPPLRERKEDIIPLVKHFMKTSPTQFRFDEEAKAALLCHEWEGNIRELQNYIVYFDCLDKELILVEDLPKQFREKPKEKSEFRFTLGILYENYKKRKPTGRRTIVVEAEKKGIFLTEQQVRSIFSEMGERGIVEITKGRSGTRLTEKGLVLAERIL